MKILIVEDEPVLREGLTDLIASAGHTVEAVADGEAGLNRGSDPDIEFLLLDLMLPGLNGIEVCRRLREIRPTVPILMLTARGAEADKVEGLNCGADDYMTKPFGTDELLARIEALSRRANRDAQPELRTLSADGCEIDLGRLVARRGGTTVSITAREASILRWLFLHRSRAVSRAELLEIVWGSPGDLRTRTVDMTIANLRSKIEVDPVAPRIVVTVKGIGYAWGTA